MQDHRSATITSLVESLLPWLRIHGGRRKHVMVSRDMGGAVLLCGRRLDNLETERAFVWNGRLTEAPARDFPVCGNCANVARAIVEEADAG